MSTKSKSMAYVLGCAGITVFAFVLLGGIVFYKFLGYQNAGLDGLQNAPQASVVIVDPRAYSQASQGAAIAVSVSARGYQPLTAIELWVNGKLMGVQAAPPGGQLTFDTAFVWLPGAVGEFSLVARTLDVQGNTAVSTAVLVNILPHVPEAGADGSVAFDTGPAMAFPAAPAGAAGGGMPNSTDSVGAAKVGPPSAGDWLNDLTNQQPPQAPGLSVAVKGCTATLSIHDLSANEEGFQVFRSTDYAPAWTEIATLNSQSALDWITYPDTLQGAGQASYYVVVVNKIGQAQSDPVTASFSTADCPAAQSQQQVLLVEPVSLKTDILVDQAYCYKSLNNSDWERWPEVGFFLPGPDGFDIQKYKLAFALNGLDGKPILKTLDLRLECWGWAGGTLKYLGDVHFTNDVSNLREQDEQSAGDISIKLKFEMGDSRKAGNFDSPTPQSGEMPTVFAVLSYDPEDCQNNLPPKKQNLLGGLFYCAPLGGYTSPAFSEAPNPQPYLIWIVLYNCPYGSGAACKSVSELQSIAQANNGSVEFVIHSSASNSDGSSPIDKTSYVIPPQVCLGQRQFTVRIAYGDENSGPIMGLPSNPVDVPCYVGNLVNLNVSFDTLALGNVDDGNDDQVLELYGVFMAVSSNGSQDSRVLQYYPDTGCPGDGISLQNWAYIVGAIGGVPGQPSVLNTKGTDNGIACNRAGDGIFAIATSVNLCTSNQLFNCPGAPPDIGNNILHLSVGNGDHILLQVMLMDADVGGDDPVCIAILDTGSKSIKGWANTPGQVFVLHQDDNDNAACDVQVTVSSAP